MTMPRPEDIPQPSGLERLAQVAARSTQAMSAEQLERVIKRVQNHGSVARKYVCGYHPEGPVGWFGEQKCFVCGRFGSHYTWAAFREATYGYQWFGQDQVPQV